MQLPRTQMAHGAVVRFSLVIAVIGGFRRGSIRVLMMTEVRGDFCLLERAIRRSRREGELEGQQQEEEKDEEAAHGRIMAELLP